MHHFLITPLTGVPFFLHSLVPFGTLITFVNKGWIVEVLS